MGESGGGGDHRGGGFSGFRQFAAHKRSSFETGREEWREAHFFVRPIELIVNERLARGGGQRGRGVEEEEEEGEEKGTN